MFIPLALILPNVQVVVKFLRKSSILPDGWVEDEEMGVVPREIALLAGITHPHIVEVRTCVELCMP